MARACDGVVVAVVAGGGVVVVLVAGGYASGRGMAVGQFARVAKGVDLRSTAGNCAWARTPQLTFDTRHTSQGVAGTCTAIACWAQPIGHVSSY